ncbi:hypothetical protein [Streptomyces sp. URMC 123]|uniref:hypothetical protein n=1 Tax=Streptomyces sp. URMC 123 TaxID=3423403 RepID=UPI003F1DFC14
MRTTPSAGDVDQEDLVTVLGEPIEATAPPDCCMASVAQFLTVAVRRAEQLNPSAAPTPPPAARSRRPGHDLDHPAPGRPPVSGRTRTRLERVRARRPGS